MKSSMKRVCGEFRDVEMGECWLEWGVELGGDGKFEIGK
jgi:hypothetical protein